MKELYSPNSKRHHPPYEIFNGEQTPHAEVPERVTRILEALQRSGFHPEELVRGVPRQVIEAIHAADYIQFIKDASASIPEGGYKYPSVFSLRAGRRSENTLAKQGYYAFDMYTPLMSTTYRAAIESAGLSYQAALLIGKGEERVVYALCRPPGHHAEVDQMGGYCYINNAAVAAQELSTAGKVATLDVDFHHGNGTQHIFYGRDDVMTVSLHADPDWKFPYFSGYADEHGAGRGVGKNANFPLPEGTTNDQFQSALLAALEKVVAHRPDFLVVSLGVDTHELDPIGGFKLTTEYYEKMARTIAELDLPTVVVQEGGYNTGLLGDNVVSFLRGYDDHSSATR